MTLWFGSHTGDVRLTELLYVVADVWPGIMSLYKFQCFVLAQVPYWRTQRCKLALSGDGDQREFGLETRVTTNGNLIIPEMFHSCALNK